MFSLSLRKNIPPNAPLWSRLFFLKPCVAIISGTKTEKSQRHGEMGRKVPDKANNRVTDDPHKAFFMSSWKVIISQYILKFLS